MDKFTPKDIMVMMLIGLIFYYLTLLFVGWIFGMEINSNNTKEIFIFILGAVSGYIGGGSNKKEGLT